MICGGPGFWFFSRYFLYSYGFPVGDADVFGRVAVSFGAGLVCGFAGPYFGELLARANHLRTGLGWSLQRSARYLGMIVLIKHWDAATG